MRRLPILALLLLASGCAASRPEVWRDSNWVASILPPVVIDEAEDEAEEQEKSSGLAAVFLYLPNRIFDALDIVRARVRVGFGFGFDVRATKFADFFIGSYFTVYAGLPGPRGRMIPVLPGGIETRTGLAIGPADLTVEGFTGPGYGAGEIGAGFQLILVGVDVGVDFLEIIDFVGGIFTLDMMGDDF
jgi:hypothetical protein